MRAGENGLPVVVSRANWTSGFDPVAPSQAPDRTGLVVQDRQATTLISRANYNGMHGLVGYLVDECCAYSTASNVRGGGCVTAPFCRDISNLWKE